MRSPTSHFNTVASVLCVPLCAHRFAHNGLKIYFYRIHFKNSALCGRLFGVGFSDSELRFPLLYMLFDELRFMD